MCAVCITVWVAERLWVSGAYLMQAWTRCTHAANICIQCGCHLASLVLHAYCVGRCQLTIEVVERHPCGWDITAGTTAASRQMAVRSHSIGKWRAAFSASVLMLCAVALAAPAALTVFPTTTAKNVLELISTRSDTRIHAAIISQ